MAGRPRVPDAVKLARGTYRADRVLPMVPLVPPDESRREPPSELSEVGKAKWREWIGILSAHNILDVRYLDALVVYCKAWERLVACEAVLKEQGEYQLLESGWKVHPALIERSKLVEQVRKYQMEFGFTPASASKSAAAIKSSEKKPGVPTRQREMA